MLQHKHMRYVIDQPKKLYKNNSSYLPAYKKEYLKVKQFNEYIFKNKIIIFLYFLNLLF